MRPNTQVTPIYFFVNSTNLQAIIVPNPKEFKIGFARQVCNKLFKHLAENFFSTFSDCKR